MNRTASACQMNKWTSCMVCLCCACTLFSCTDFESQSAAKQKEAIESELSWNRFDAAENLLQKAQVQTRDSEKPYFEYNKAIISILSGHCDEAKVNLESLLDRYNESVTRRTSASKSSENNLFVARIRVALAMSILCPGKTYVSLDTADYENVLSHLYSAVSLGIDVRDIILYVTKEWYSECTEFIPESQKMASSYEHALPFEQDNVFNAVVCPEGVWVKFEARAHEKFDANIELTQLERKVWLDDSSRLPFSQVHFELYEAPVNGTDFGMPVSVFRQPLPKAPPAAEDYEKYNAEIRDVKLNKDGIYYAHLYTKNNGEAQLKIALKRAVDCEYIDDLTSYSADLKLNVIDMTSESQVEGLILCPARPDHFRFSLKPEQSAFFNIITRSNDVETLENFNIFIREGKNNFVDMRGVSTAMTTISKSKYMVFSVYPELMQVPQIKMHIPKVVLIHNGTMQEQTYEIKLSLEKNQSLLEYQVHLAKSSDCDSAPEVQEHKISLEDLELKEAVFMNPVWNCPGQTVNYIPELSPNTPLLRTLVDYHFFSNELIRPEDVSFNSYLMNKNDKDYLVELGQGGHSHWKPESLVKLFQLKKPVTSDIIFRSTVSDEKPGFSLLIVQMQQNEDNSEDSSDDSNKENSKEDNKQQRDDNQKQNVPNKSPDKPSESPATPKGPGTEAQGDDSTPDESAKGNHASKYDLRQQERDYIDALLDDIESGAYHVPLPGNVDPPASDKDW
ncbi:MAG: hypothetical protein IJM59_04335 [Proteobacteria bacterium]|nr:hypothetical protein [Pseudomonadota bacterium]